jgi:hypothetical protein
MRARLLPDWIAEYLAYTEHSESPTVFHFWTAVSVLAGALRRRVWIDQRYFQWTPNFYIFFVAPPGVVSKSTTAGIGMRLLRRVKEVTFGPESLTWQSLVRSLAESTQNITMSDGLIYPMSAITINAGELGTFFNPDDREMVDVLVELWDSKLGPFTRGTKSQGVDVVENPCLNIIGCTTPAWIAQNFPEYMVGGGFMSRSIFIFADKKRHLEAYPADRIESAAAKLFEDRLTKDLETISTMKGEMRLTPEAKEWGQHWYERHWSHGLESAPDANPERYGGYIARKQTHIHKLAIVLNAAITNDLTITLESLQKAEKIISASERDMSRVFGNIGLSDSGRHVRELVAYVRAFGSVGKAKLWRALMSQLGRYQVFEDCLQAALSANLIGIRAGPGNESEYYPLNMEPTHGTPQ